MYAAVPFVCSCRGDGFLHEFIERESPFYNDSSTSSVRVLVCSVRRNIKKNENEKKKLDV